jgi:protein-S-isoprenylcysteine O-methyltransferase Ste14
LAHRTGGFRAWFLLGRSQKQLAARKIIIKTERTVECRASETLVKTSVKRRRIVTPWFGKAVFIAGMIAMMVIRAPHGRRSRQVKVVESRKGVLESALLALVSIAMLLLPLTFITTSLLSFADYSLSVTAFSVGVACLGLGLWLFYRSHGELSDNWSVSLELREGHTLVTRGVYQHIRHPMYTAIFLLALAQVLLLPNWIAGPACILAFLLMLSLRLGPEERMMSEKFGETYTAYQRKTKRLIPSVW